MSRTEGQSGDIGGRAGDVKGLGIVGPAQGGQISRARLHCGEGRWVVFALRQQIVAPRRSSSLDKAMAVWAGVGSFCSSGWSWNARSAVMWLKRRNDFNADVLLWVGDVGMKVGHFLSDRDLDASRNNLTLVRLVLALAVIYSHSLESAGSYDETIGVLGQSMSWFAVNGFFALSGFLMYRSLEKNASVASFALSRFMRIWPGMITMCLVVVIIFLPFTTVSTWGYLTGADTLRFLVRNQLTLNWYSLTGVYCGDGVRHLCNINGSLWTIPWEVRCYVVIALLAKVGLLRSKPFHRIVVPMTLAGALLFLFPPVQNSLNEVLHGHLYFFEQIARLWTAFVIGAAAYANRHRLPLSWVGAVALLLLAYFTRSLFFGDVVRSIMILYWVMCVGFLAAGKIPLAPSLPDYSFGIYIYGMPVMRVIQLLMPSIEGHLLAFATMLLVIPFAAFSWEVVERPAQLLRKKFRKGATITMGSPKAEDA